jgi:hypothetical protein
MLHNLLIPGLIPSPNQNIQSSHVCLQQSLPAEWPTGGEARKGFGRLAIRPCSEKFHRNVTFYKIFVDIPSLFDIGAGDYLAIHRNNLSSWPLTPPLELLIPLWSKL